MKPLHVALVVLGAALAGGLAVKMTEPPPLQVTAPAAVASPAPAPAASPVSAPMTSPASVPAPVVRTQPPVTTAMAPPPVYAVVETPKPKPFPKPAVRPVEPASPVKAPNMESKVEPPPPATYQEPPPSLPPPRQVVLETGTWIPVRLSQTLSTEHVVAGDTFEATLADPLIVNGLVIAERGSRASGRVVDSKKTELQLELSAIHTADGQRVTVSTEPLVKESGGSALGALIGLHKPVGLGSETVIRFRLVARVTITERQL
jgi:hypothetical protein